MQARPHYRVGTTEELLTHIVSGHSIRMSNPESRSHRTPRLIRPNLFASIGFPKTEFLRPSRQSCRV